MFSKLKYNFYKDFHENNKKKYIYDLNIKNTKKRKIYKKVIYNKKKIIKYISFINSLIFINNFKISFISYLFYSALYWINLISNNNEFFNDYKNDYKDLTLNFLINNLLIYKNFINLRSNFFSFYLSLIIITLNFGNFIKNIINKFNNNKVYLEYNNSDVYFDFNQTGILFINFIIKFLKDNYISFFLRYIEIFYMIRTISNFYISRKN